mgnify:CR=1 FL=1
MRIGLALCVVLAALALPTAASDPALKSQASGWGALDLASGVVQPGTKKKFSFR